MTKQPRQKPTITNLPPRLPRETDLAYERRIAAFLCGDNVRSKADLREFKTADFHLDRS